MNLQEAMVGYSYGQVSFEELIALKNEVTECEHTNQTQKNAHLIICDDCGEEFYRDYEKAGER